MAVNLNERGYWNSIEQCEVADEMEQLRAEIAALKAKLAKAKKDAEILAWLFDYTLAMLYVLFDANDEKELRSAIAEAMKGK